MTRLTNEKITKQSEKELKTLTTQEEEEAGQLTEVEEKSNSNSHLNPHLIKYQENSHHAKPKTV